MAMAEDDEDISDFDRDKKEKQRLVVDAVASHCSVDSSFEDLRVIADAILQHGDTLEIENLAGGYTNYTYKLFLGSDPSKALFSKLCFPRAFWNPDPDLHYDVQRTENEYIMMERFAKLAPGCVATPYFIIDIDDMKLLVAQWSPADEQMANQFIDGSVDLRVAKNLASSVATLHSMEVDPEFNTDARECMVSVFPAMKEELLSYLIIGGDGDDDDPPSTKNKRAVQLAKEFGEDLCHFIFDACTESYRSKECAVHSDLHAFNVLVEKKPDVQYLEEFGPNGSFVICDWEMAMSGPLGVDMGRVYSIPVACMMAHAIQGNDDVAKGIVLFMDTYWDHYQDTIKTLIRGDHNDKEHDDFLRKSYRNGMGWLGWKLFGMSFYGWFIPFLPIEDPEVDALKESLMVLSLELIRWGFGGYEEGLSIQELSARLHATLENELLFIQKDRQQRSMPTNRRRRSSVLRETNLRVSDSSYTLGRTSLSKILDLE